MFAAPFDYYRPDTLDEALKLMREVKGARLLAGGHSLIPAMKLRMASPAALVDISRIAQLKGIALDANGLRIGALTTHAEVAASDLVRVHCPVLADAALHIGDTQVRNRGTIGGSVAHADPAADYPTVLLLLGATMHVQNGAPRDIPAESFFVDFFTTAIQPGEILAAVTVPALEGAQAIYLKHRHPASSFAVVGVGVLLRLKNGKCDDVRIVIGGTTAFPLRASAAERILHGEAPTAAVIDKAAAAVGEEISSPIGDSYASGEFRVHLARVMTRRALLDLAPKA